MSLYSQAVEYYSSISDAKYMYFTERIQNTLLKPHIMQMMKESNSGDALKREEFRKQARQKREKEQELSHKDLMELKQKEHDERKRMKLDQLTITMKVEVLNDPESKQELEVIEQTQQKAKEAI
mmetsp:Transcript_24414/g.37845  ORF Transcript_24414/g.37845 Transcript_24414/m.37845 type:complete len:124 (-) Transcript_24414:625-996(-)